MIKKNRGITVITLSIAVIIILIVTGMLVYSAKDSIYVKNLTNMQNDISNLRDKISLYYSQYGALPASTEFKSIPVGMPIGLNDTGRFLIIDLQALDGLTLNYGKDYEKYKNNPDIDQSELIDIYIINEDSHNIFYVQGVGVNENGTTKMYYTDYTEGDKEAVELKTVEGVLIPEGFYYVGGTKEEGIVISDDPDDEGKGTSHEVAQTLQGNQFVWVPVEVDEDFKTYEGYQNGSLQSRKSNCEEPYSGGYETEQDEYYAMKTSVLRYNGFYVGRYEAGTTASSGTGIRGNLVVKQGANVYNNIKWGNSMTDATGGAVELAKNFDTERGYTSVTSTLIYGVQWDAIMAWIDPAYKTGSCAEDSFVRDSTGKGYYNQSSPTVTGASESYTVKNIYDLAGNCYEWTMESYDTNYRVIRGR